MKSIFENNQQYVLTPLKHKNDWFEKIPISSSEKQKNPKGKNIEEKISSSILYIFSRKETYYLRFPNKQWWNVIQNCFYMIYIYLEKCFSTRNKMASKLKQSIGPFHGIRICTNNFKIIKGGEGDHQIQGR